MAMEKIDLPCHHEGAGDTTLVQEHLNLADRFQMAAEVFRQLDDTAGIRIFWLLCHCEQCAVNISAMTHLPASSVSAYLGSLEDSGLIVSRREGEELRYRAADTEQSRLLHRAIEQILEITCPETGEEWESEHHHNSDKAETDQEESGGGPFTAPCAPLEEGCLTEYQARQIQIVREVHDRLLQHMDRRVTIEELSRQYLIDSTTLKAAFKAVYGTPLATHIKGHRMEQAAKLLRETDLSVAEVARAVGYDSPSRFTSSFKSVFRILPAEYRRSVRETREER